MYSNLDRLEFKALSSVGLEAEAGDSNLDRLEFKVLKLKKLQKN